MRRNCSARSLVSADHLLRGQGQAAFDVPDHRVLELVAMVAMVTQGGGVIAGEAQRADRIERLGTAGQVGVRLLREAAEVGEQRQGAFDRLRYRRVPPAACQGRGCRRPGSP